MHVTQATVHAFGISISSSKPYVLIQTPKKEGKRRSDAVQFAEAGWLVRWQAADEGIEVWDHALVLLDDLMTMLVQLRSF
jgi:hypothetical protein